MPSNLLNCPCTRSAAGHGRASEGAQAPHGHPKPGSGIPTDTPIRDSHGHHKPGICDSLLPPSSVPPLCSQGRVAPGGREEGLGCSGMQDQPQLQHPGDPRGDPRGSHGPAGPQAPGSSLGSSCRGSGGERLQIQRGGVEGIRIPGKRGSAHAPSLRVLGTGASLGRECCRDGV